MKHTTKNYLKLLVIVILAVLIYCRFKKISYLEGDALPLPDVTTDIATPAVTTPPPVADTPPPAAVIAPLTEGTYGVPLVTAPAQTPTVMYADGTSIFTPTAESLQKLKVGQLEAQVKYYKDRVEALAAEKDKAASAIRSKTNVDKYKEAKSIFASAILNPADLRNIYGATKNDKCYKNKKATFKITKPGIECTYRNGIGIKQTSTVY
jgi:hypothetical protein